MIYGAIVVLVCVLAQRGAWGQAMGKAVVDGGTGDVAAGHPAMVAAPVIIPAAVAGPSVATAPAEVSGLAAAAKPESVRTDLAVGDVKAVPRAAPTEKASPEAAAPLPLGPMAITDAPATRAASTAPSAIEMRPIRPRTSDPATTAPAGEASGTAAGNGGGGGGGGMWSGIGSLAQVGAALAVVIGLIFIGKALARKFLPGAVAGNGKGVIEVLARHALCKNQSLVLVRIGSQIVALSQGKETSESVLVISAPEEVARIIGQVEGRNPKSIQAGFTRLLANARLDLENGASEEEELHKLEPQALDDQLEEMAAAKRQLMELRQHVRSVRDSLPRT